MLTSPRVAVLLCLTILTKNFSNLGHLWQILLLFLLIFEGLPLVAVILPNYLLIRNAGTKTGTHNKCSYLLYKEQVDIVLLL